MKWIMYLGNSTLALVKAFHNYCDENSSQGFIFPEISTHYYGGGQATLTHQEQINFLSKSIDCLKLDNNIKEYVFATHSEIFFLAFRHAVWAGRINSEDVEIRWLDGSEEHPYVLLFVDKDGRIDHWPNDMFNETERLLSDFLGPSAHRLTE